MRADLGDDVDLVLDGGPCAIGVESTIVDCSGAEPRDPAARRRPARAARSDRRRRRCRCGPPASTRRRARWPSHYAPDARVEVVEASDVVGARDGAARRRSAGRRARADGAARLDACPRPSSCWPRRATPTSTPACCTRGCGRPTSGSSTSCSRCAPVPRRHRRRRRRPSPPRRGPTSVGAMTATRRRAARSACSTPGSVGSRCCARSSTCSRASRSLYFGDTGRFPYGPKPADEVLKYARRDRGPARGPRVEAARGRVQQRGGRRARARCSDRSTSR